jgi:hypothetical protein
VIKGLSNLTPLGIAKPKYIPSTSKMYHDLVAANGQMKAFGMDLALKPFSHHSSWIAAVPYFALVGIAVGLQYFQMAQMNSRNRKMGQAMPAQQQMIQRIMPIAFAYFYIIIPAAVCVVHDRLDHRSYRHTGSFFRTGVSNPGKQGNGAPRRLPGRGSTSTSEAVKPEIISPAKSEPSSSKPKEHPRSKKKRPRKDL